MGFKIKIKNPFKKGGAGDTSPPISDPKKVPSWVPIVGGKRLPTPPKK